MNEIAITHMDTNAQTTQCWIALQNNVPIGHIFMQLEPDNKIKFMDAWVHPDHRRKGVYRMLWETRWEHVKEKYSGYKVYAWCKEKSLPLLIEKGFDTGDVCTYVEKII